MTPDEFQQLKYTARDGGLPPDERATLRGYLAVHPAAAADWEDEETLDRMLDALPDVPVPSNFTARVLAEVVREQQRGARSRSRAAQETGIVEIAAAGTRASSPLLRIPGLAWLLNPVAAVTALLLLLGAGALVVQQQRDLRHAAMAESLAKFSDTTALPDIEVLRDFAAIQRLSQTLAAGDGELAAALSGGGQ